MAFNPFHGFRKHQKSVFAVLVIVCMFVFILQFTAGADPVSRMMSWFGAKRGQGPVVITLNGTKIYETDLGKLSRERQMASDLVFIAALQAEPPAENNRGQMTFSQRLVQNIQQGERPFGSISTNEDLLDFMVWRHQADRLGITLTEADIRKTINRVAGKDIFGNKPFTQSRLVESVIGMPRRSGKATLTANELLTAVTDEFRVVLAQEALLGHGPGAFGGRPSMQEQRFEQLIHFPARWPLSALPGVTPGEFLQYYREQCSKMNVWILPVAVKTYEPQARQLKQAPSDEVLHRLYDDYKGFVPAPERDRPAFKEPERVKLEWVSAGPELPYFKDQSRQRTLLPPAFNKLIGRGSVFASIGSQIGYGASIFGSVGSAAPWLALSAAPHTFDRTLGKYGDYLDKQRPTVIMSNEGRPTLHDISLSRPSQLGKIAGEFTAGASLGTGSLSTVSVAWGGAVAVSELEERKKLLSAELWILGSGIAPQAVGPLLPSFSLGALTYRSNVNDFWDVRDRLLSEEEASEATALVTKDMDDFSKELAKLKGKPDEARKLIDDTIKKYGLNHGKMDTALDKYKLAKDDAPGLKKVREEYLESRSAPDRAEQFADFAFQQVTGSYDPKEFHRTKGDTYLIWRTETVLAREPKFVEVRDKVVDAWYLEEARSLARKQAEEWSATARKLQKTLPAPEIIKSLREDSKTEGFTFYGVARLVSQSALEGMRGRTYSPYTIEASKIAHPRPNMVDQMVKQLKDEGDSMVISDQPEQNYYVIVRESRKHNPDADIPEFRDILSNTPDRDQLWNTYVLPTKRRAHEQMVLKQLRLDAGATLKENGDYDLPADIRARSAADSSDGE